jgi:uncharacterized membrane protein
METPRHVRWTLALENASSLDAAVRSAAPLVDKAFASGTRGELLRGDWLGHAIHPVLTDVVLGSWTSATVLDVIGGVESRKAAQRLVGVGLLAVGPTAWTGWAEWASAGEREKRVGLVHAATNAVAIGAYTSSWLARRRGDQRAGVRRALVGAAVASVGGYLGGHLAAARKVGTHHEAFDAA